MRPTWALRAGATVLMMSAALVAEAASVKTLANGLRYLILEDHASPIVSLQIWVRCGGVDEDERSSGVSHFLEHMIFKGNERLSANEIAAVVEKSGGAINAATGGETTQYYIDMPSDAFEQAFDVLADSVLHPSFPPEEFEKERHVILEEIKRRNDDPQSDLWDAFLDTLYTSTPYRRNVIGTTKGIEAMTRDVMLRQHALYYVPNNLVVVVAGDVDQKTALRKIKQHFAALPEAPPPPRPGLLEGPRESPLVRSITRTARQAYVALGFLGPTLQDPDQVTADVLAAMLGGGESTRLYQTFREQRGVVWSIGAQFLSHVGTGVFGIFAECPPEKARSLPGELYLFLNELEAGGFTPAELARAKAQIKSGWLMGQETYHGQASQWGFYTALGRPELMTRYLKMLDALTLEDVQQLFRRCFDGRELSGAMVFPAEGGR